MPHPSSAMMMGKFEADFSLLLMPSPNFLDPDTHQTLVTRLQSLTPASQRHWGSMTVGQMIVHCTDQIRISIGEKAIATRLPGFAKALGRWWVTRLMVRFPKNMFTLPELDPNRAMTRPTDFEADRQQLLALIAPARYSGREVFEHPAFGRLSRAQFGEVVWKHLDHHLRQFGV